MTELLLWGAAVVAAGVLLFGFSIGIGILLGRRMDRGIQARVAAAEAHAAMAGQKSGADASAGETGAAPGTQAEATETHRKESSHG